jgi:hypothetical protein
MADSHTEHPMKQPLREPRATGILPYPFPPPSLVVAEAKDDELSYYGLPSREAAGFSPTATAFRRAFLLPPPGGRPLSFLRVLETAMNTQPPGIRPIAAIASWPIQKSINWSGGYVVASDGRSFKSVMGCWTVPAVSLPPGGTAQEYLKNETLGIILQAFNASAPPPCRISGATAEWIMERPSPLGSDGWDAYALPAYTPFAFTGCVAESTAPYSNALREHDLESASLIRMYEIIATPPGTRTISTAKRVLESVQRLELTRLIA